MSVDTSSVFKRPLHCLRCDGDFYFTLRSIAQSQKLACPQCGRDLNPNNRSVVADVRITVQNLDKFYSKGSVGAYPHVGLI
jgi:uncharacterized paraquat-inducible protein A